MYYAYLKLTLLVTFMWQVKYAPQRYIWFSLFAEIMFCMFCKMAVNTELVSNESLLLWDISSSYGRMFSKFILSWDKILFDKWTPVFYIVSFNLYCMLLILKKLIWGSSNSTISVLGVFSYMENDFSVL